MKLIGSRVVKVTAEEGAVPLRGRYIIGSGGTSQSTQSIEKADDSREESCIRNIPKAHAAFKNRKRRNTSVLSALSPDSMSFFSSVVVVIGRKSCVMSAQSFSCSWSIGVSPPPRL